MTLKRQQQKIISCRTAGFTLLELLISLVIITILLAFGLPSLQQTLSGNRIAAQANDLMTSLSLARSEAIKRNLRVSVCASANGFSCGSDWKQGWIVFTDPDSDGSPDQVLRVRQALDGPVTLNWNNVINNYVSYAPTGELLSLSGASTGLGGTFIFSDAGTSENRAITVNELGRAREG